jgi:hypothetical protein
MQISPGGVILHAEIRRSRTKSIEQIKNSNFLKG